MSTLNPALARFEPPIRVPGRRLLQKIPLGFVSARVRGAGHRAVNHEVPLIPFIDFLLCIVLFLLASFSVTGDICVDANITLPRAGNAQEMVEAPMVALVGNTLLVDGTPAGSTRGVLEANRLQRVDELFQILVAKRQLWTQLNPNKPFHGVCILQIDKDVPALVVKSVFQTAAYAGFPNVSFMVRKRSSG